MVFSCPRAARRRRYRFLVGDSSCVMSNGEDRKGQLGLGVARVVSMVIVALLEKGVVCGLGQPRLGIQDIQEAVGLADQEVQARLPRGLGDGHPGQQLSLTLLLLLGQQYLDGEELQAFTGKVVAQLLQAIDPQGLGARGQ